MTIMTIDRVALSRVVAIANGKGGSGQDQPRHHPCRAGGKAGYEILLLDLDPQGNVGEDLGYTGAGLGDAYRRFAVPVESQRLS